MKQQKSDDTGDNGEGVLDTGYARHARFSAPQP
jgi:hypothetical protein